MAIARTALIFTLAGFVLSACAYAPERSEASWTDAQLDSAPPGDPPAFIPDDRVRAITFYEYDAYQLLLADKRDALVEAAEQIPEADGPAESYAAEARDRATPPNPQ